MENRISGVDSNHPINGNNQPGEIKKDPAQFYSAAKGPGFAKLLNHFFPGNVTPQMVASFERNMTEMISSAIRKAAQKHKEMQAKIKRRIEEKD